MILRKIEAVIEEFNTDVKGSIELLLVYIGSFFIVGTLGTIIASSIL